ncbi:speckle-type POZ protein-like [Paramacrobiotus metropolitanus]|uniref:speckle-type POZ protein-like n=1 Tax=Paramacrobiotus metropolitanus TaxID=2943436 RepID=UPI002445A382|nr:speckle-type POZ protein-like [Paramacrobiotus metropolitanus]
MAELGLHGHDARWILMVKPCHIVSENCEGKTTGRKSSTSARKSTTPVQDGLQSHRAAVYVSLLNSPNPNDDYSGDDEFPAEITIMVLNKAGECAYTVGEERLGRTFAANSATWGFEGSGIPHTRLFGAARHCLLVNGTLILRCQIRFLIERPSRTISKDLPGSMVPHPLHEAALLRYRDLYHSREFADFTLLSNDGQAIPVHRGILSAHSPMFALIFDEEEADASATREMADLNGEVLDILLEFIYYSGVERVEPVAEPLLVAAANYEIDDLKDICEGHLVNAVNSKSAARLLVLAEEYELETLEKACMEFITKGEEFVLEGGDREKVVSTALVKKIVRHCSVQHAKPGKSDKIKEEWDE